MMSIDSSFKSSIVTLRDLYVVFKTLQDLHEVVSDSVINGKLTTLLRLKTEPSDSVNKILEKIDAIAIERSAAGYVIYKLEKKGALLRELNDSSSITMQIIRSKY